MCGGNERRRHWLPIQFNSDGSVTFDNILDFFFVSDFGGSYFWRDV